MRAGQGGKYGMASANKRPGGARQRVLAGEAALQRNALRRAQLHFSLESSDYMEIGFPF